MEKIVLESAKGVAGGKIQLQFSQMVDLGNRSENALALLNASDERFAQAKPRYAWLTAEPKDAATQLGIEALASLAEGEVLQIDAVDPRFASRPDTSLNIEIVESTEGSEYDKENIETRAKRAGKDGDYIMKNGKHIFTKTRVAIGTPKHNIFTETTRQEVNSVSDAVKSALGDA
jgi:hypothetical protein